LDFQYKKPEISKNEKSGFLILLRSFGLKASRPSGLKLSSFFELFDSLPAFWVKEGQTKT
jgi:hypothetical protein